MTNAGRGAEAARAYLAAAPGAKAAEALELRRRAAEQQLISGHIDEGLGDHSYGARHRRHEDAREPPAGSFFSRLAGLCLLKLRGRRASSQRDSTQIAPDTLIRIDTCWSVSIGLGTVDTIRGMGFAKRHLHLALDAGEPYRVARALAIEAAYSGARGLGYRQRARRNSIEDSMTALAERVNHPHAIGLGQRHRRHGRLPRGALAKSL